MKYLSLLVLLAFTSCLKEEDPVPMPEPGEIETVTIEIGYPYKNQVFYNCATNSVVSTNSKWDWDLGFECSEQGKHVSLNTAKGVLVSNQGRVDFSAVNSVSGIVWQWDASSGNLDSTAVGSWWQYNDVYILDRQYDEEGVHLGYVKIQFQTVTDKEYHFKYANLDGSNERTVTVQKEPNRNFVGFSFDDGKTKIIEPESDKWDLLFTNYQHFFSNLTLPFVITGVLSNSYSGVEVAEVFNNQFLSVSLSDTINYTFTNERDEIGFDWKIRNGQDNSFTIDGEKSFIVKTKEGIYYKIRFIDFYNSQGVKGYPKFEIQKL